MCIVRIYSRGEKQLPNGSQSFAKALGSSTVREVCKPKFVKFTNYVLRELFISLINFTIALLWCYKLRVMTRD